MKFLSCRANFQRKVAFLPFFTFFPFSFQRGAYSVRNSEQLPVHPNRHRCWLLFISEFTIPSHPNSHTPNSKPTTQQTQKSMQLRIRRVLFLATTALVVALATAQEQQPTSTAAAVPTPMEIPAAPVTAPADTSSLLRVSSIRPTRCIC